MKTRYDLNEAIELIKKNKRQKMIIFIMFVISAIIIFLLTFFFMNVFVMIFDIILTSFCFSYWFTYFFYYRKENLNRYHFLAKIQHYDHEQICDQIEMIDIQEVTIEGMITNTVLLQNGRKVQIEKSFVAELFMHKTYRFDIVDRFIVGYEEVSENE